jgi:cell wall-associated NlpC family hydrolase
MLHRKIVTVLGVGVASLTLASTPALAATGGGGRPASRRLLAYEYALRQRGKGYCWGGTGPSCYDCSGLVYKAYRHVHIRLGRTTYDMLHSGRLIRISRARARRGDLAFYGTGHVELYDRGHVTFGAHDYGSPIGYLRFNRYWHPTAFYRVRGGGRR